MKILKKLEMVITEELKILIKKNYIFNLDKITSFNLCNEYFLFSFYKGKLFL